MRYIDVDTAKKISKIGLGTAQFGARAWGYGERYARREADTIVSRALELGVTLFDTAEIYGFEAGRLARRALVQGVAFRDAAATHGFGRSEQILGRALRDKRETVFLATKFYPTIPAVPVTERHAVAGVNRLGARYIDLYQVHQPRRMAPPRRDHARRPCTAPGRAGPRGGCEQRLPRTLVCDGAGAAQPGAQQPDRLQPGRQVGGAGSAALR